MSGTATSNTPWHIWVVGFLSLICNSCMAFIYWKSLTGQSGSLADIQSGSVEVLGHGSLWANLVFGMGVLGVVLASTLILLRSRLAVSTCLFSLVCVALGLGLRVLEAQADELLEPSTFTMPLIVIAMIALLAWYSGMQLAKGVLR